MKVRVPKAAVVFLTLFVILIFSGIALKRIWGMPQYMVFFHLPAAVCLVLGGIEIKKVRQRDYEAEIASVRARLAKYEDPQPAALKDSSEAAQ